MTTATVTSKGQITVPLAVRDALQLKAGDKVEFVETSSGHFELIAASNDVSQLKGMVKAGETVSIEDMNQAIKTRAGQ